MLESLGCVSRAASLSAPTATGEGTAGAPKRRQQQDEQHTSTSATSSEPSAGAGAAAAKGRPLFPKEARTLAKRAQQAARAGSLPALTQRYSVRITRCDETAASYER